MKRFKKRTIALVLASVVTVVGAFGTNNYANSLMGLKFENTSNGVNMVVQTKLPYTGNVTPLRKDSNTYILMLPEINSLASTPDLKNVSANIANVSIRTMPYSNTAKGYTRITVKVTTPNTNLLGSNQIFIEGDHNEIRQIEEKQQKKINEDIQKVKSNRSKQVEKENRSSATKNNSYNRNNIQNSEVAYQPSTKNRINREKEETTVLPETPESSLPIDDSTSSNSAYIWLWALLIVLASSYFMIRAKNKMQELAGENLEIDVDDDNDKKPIKKEDKQQKIKKIRNTVNSLDSKYSKTTMPGRSEYTESSTPVKTAKPAEELEIIDLDELFQEQKAKKSSSKEEEENDALEDFLSGFSFDDNEDFIQDEIEDLNSFDDETYEKIINSKNLSFTKDDITCINQLLDSEISNDTRQNIKDFAVSEAKPIKPSKKEILENFVTSLSVSQNVSFTSEDVEALNKLINVELDPDFVTDLKTDPKRTKEMALELEFYDKPKKPSEIITMSVKNMLPDLSEALKQQGGKKIESERRAETIYFSEGYEVKTLSLEDSLPDLSIEINKKSSYDSQPSAKYDIVDSNYTIGSGELKISSELPDLTDVMANPEKYKKAEPKKVEVNEEKLLNNINNIQFKPFYDGTNEFEVLNKPEDAPSVSDMEEEFKQFGNLEISKDEEIYTENTLQDDYDDFKSLYSNDYVDLDKEKDTYKLYEQPSNEEQIPNIEQNEQKDFNTNATNGKTNEKKTLSEDLMKKIEAAKIQREIRRAKIIQKDSDTNTNQSVTDSVKPISDLKCIIDGETLNIVSSVEFAGNMGCHLGKKDNGYVILGYIGDNLFKIKNYEVLKSEKIQARMSETLADGLKRYIVRIGIHKFIVDVDENNIKYVMDLC